MVRLVEVIMDSCHTYIVMELLTGGELFARIKQRKRFNESVASNIMYQLTSVVKYMHSVLHNLVTCGCLAISFLNLRTLFGQQCSSETSTEKDSVNLTFGDVIDAIT